MARLDGVSLGVIFAGGVLAYAGIKGISVTGALQAIVKGQSPATAPPAAQITGSGAITGTAGPGGPGPPAAGSGYIGPRKAYQALRAAGFSQPAAIMMTAIGGVESGWRTTALNDTPATGDLSVGVWQLNYFGNLGPERTALFGMTWQQLRVADLQTQADAAFRLYQSAGGFGPWQPDITSGKILRFWAQASAAAAGG